ncbi:hypothetical protein LL946_08720 [Knoellia locipacati]|uniref:Fis family transcriptional regulator n=1 Tax=Knoellia locipacati TaxID=882824 RepID=UPI00384B2F65
MSTTNPTPHSASFDPSQPAVVIEHLALTDSEVVAEARRWSTGRRGAAIAALEMGDADLGSFVTQAMSVGARAIAGAGSAQDTFELERLVAEVGDKTVASSAEAADATAKAAADAAETMGKAAEAARKAIAESEASTRKGFADTVAVSTKALRDEVERLVGGDNPELLARLGPVLDAAGRKMGEQAFEQTDKLLAKVSRQFDPADPTSPFAKQATALAEQQKALTASMDKNHLALVGKVEELAKAVEVDKAARAAVVRTASVTPLKGGTFESEVGAVIDHIAVGLGDEYSDTGGIAGTIARCKKGDGLLVVGAGQARVVIEMHDSTDGRVWNDYLDEAERNREAVASIGVVRNTGQNKGQTIRVLGPRRVVLAFDPASDDSNLLRTVVQLVRTSAIAASSRRDVEGLETAEESIQAAIALLEGINTIRKASGSVRKNADLIDKQCNSIQTGITRHLGEALDALAGVAMEAVEGDASAPDGSAQGAA